MPFRDIVGHRHLLDLVAGAATRESLPPSLIFAGPEGVGKRAAALALAQLVNCPTRVQAPHLAAPDLASEIWQRQIRDNDACGTCASCTRIARGVHADVLLVEPGDTGVIKVDQVREVDRAHGVPAVRGPPPRRHRRRGGRDARPRRRTRCSRRSRSRRRPRCSCSSRRGPTCCCRRSGRAASGCGSGGCRRATSRRC